MEIHNHSALVVEHRSASPELHPDVVVTQVVGKLLGAWDRNGRWQLAWDARPMVLRDRQNTPWGDLCADFHHLKAGCDIYALGQIYSPDPKGSTQMQVELTVGQEQRALQVFGPRRWVYDRAGALVPSSPEPFGLLDMRWSHSFGGACQGEDSQVHSYLFNPEGVGYQRCAKQAKGARLPQIEDPKALIQHFEDTPMPINLAAIPAHCPLNLFPDPTPLGNALLAQERVVLPPEFHNVSHPTFRFAKVPAGAHFRLQGMDPSQGLSGHLPDLRFHAAVELGDRKRECWLDPASIVILPETRQVSISYSAHFAFRWVPQERRKIQIKALTRGKNPFF